MSDAASLFGVLDHAAQHAPGKCALISAHTRTSFRELRDAATAVGSGLAELGFTAGDRLAVLTANRVEAVELFMACAYAGIVDVPLNAFLKGEFLSYQLRDSGVTAIAVDAAGLRALRAVLDRVPLITTVITFDEAADDQPASGTPRVVSYRSVRNAAEAAVAAARSPSDLMSILYTSGTTGAPKGCMLSDGYYLHVARVLADNMGVRADDTIFTALPFYHCTARSVVFLPALLNCATTVLEPGFDASATVARWAETGATINMGVGAMGLAVMAQPESNLDQSHQLRLNFSSPLTELDQDRLAQRFGAPVYAESYGQTECMPILFDRPSHEGRPRGLTVLGTPAPYLDVRLLDDAGREVALGTAGEVCVRPLEPEVMFQGYWGRPEATLQTWANLWHHTGDLAICGEDGTWRFVDRKKDSIRRRGENVSSSELERAIAEHELVAEVAVHGVPSAKTDDEIKACIVAVDGAEIKPADLYRFFVDNLPYFAVPRYVEILSGLPRNATSRVMKTALREVGITDATWDFVALGLRIDRESRR